jgi:ketosteroid isomerase-like protein
MPDSGKYLTVWQKQADGGWKIIRDINNTDIAPKG